MGLINDIVEKRLLTSGTQPAGTYEFWMQDSPEKWRQNSKIMGKGWEYRNKTLNYTVNSQNYRAPEWDQIDWANSVVIYGCSFVFGEGLDDRDTIAAQLEQIINRPVINLGASGTGAQWQLINQTLLLTNFCEPWATVTIWPSVSRTVLFEDPLEPKKLGPWMGRENYFLEYNRGCNPINQFYFFRQQSRLMHRNRWFDAAFENKVNTPYGNLGIPLLEFKGDARDLGHPGRDTARRTAEWISSQL